ncbi:MAG TPA: hypothetical protein VGB26_13640 [Nitrospiria bacterium]|jgi:uncharacterized coiled-coil protein SlyX
MTNSDIQKFEQRFKDLEAILKDQQKTISKLNSNLSQVQAEVSQAKEKVQEVYSKNVTTCKSCQTEYDLFSHHYSIGLFDNIVYVKCPKCQTAMPVDPKEGVKKE